MARDRRPAFAAVAVAAAIAVVAAWVALREPPSSAADRVGSRSVPAPAPAAPVVSLASAPPPEPAEVTAPTALDAGSTTPTDVPPPTAPAPHPPGLRELTIVVTANGAPVAGARLRFPQASRSAFQQPTELVRVTDVAGEARYGLIMPGRKDDAHVGLLVEAPGHATEARLVRLGPDGARVSIELGPDRPVTGRVVDAAGRPVPGATLRAWRWSDEGRLVDAPTAVATTDERGAYVLRGLAPAVIYQVWVAPPAPHLARSLWIPSPAAEQDVVLELGASVRLEVTYPPALAPRLLGAPKDERGRSQFRARWFTERTSAWARRGADFAWQPTTLGPPVVEVADDGRVVLRYMAVPPGELFFTLETDVFGPTPVSGGVEAHLVGRRAPARTIDVRVVDRAGLPLRGRAVWCDPALGGWGGGSVQTNADGRGSLACPAEREVRVELRATGHRPRTLDAPPGVTALGEVVLEAD